MKTPPHKTVTASNGSAIDEKLHPLLEALWANGLTTEFSCEDYGVARSGGRPGVGSAYIKFATDEDVDRFCASLDRFYREELFVDFPTDDIAEITEQWSGV